MIEGRLWAPRFVIQQSFAFTCEVMLELRLVTMRDWRTLPKLTILSHRMKSFMMQLVVEDSVEFPGLGTTSDIFYNPHRPRSSSIGYTPSFVSQLQDQVQKMKEHCEERVASVTQSYEMRFAAQQESQRRLEETMLRMMDAMKEHCGDILPSDLFRPRGPDPDGAW